MKKTSLFLLMTLFATLSFSADSITRKVSVTGTVEKEIMPDTANISFRIITKNKSKLLFFDLAINNATGIASKTIIIVETMDISTVLIITFIKFGLFKLV